MAQDRVSRKELLAMHVNQTRIFTLTNPTRLASACVTCNQMKKERKGEWSVKRDYETLSVSITRNK